MLFIVLVLLSALLIESIGTFISVLGLAALFSSSPLILAMAIALDVGKVTAVSFAYKFWDEISILMKAYMVAAIIVLMAITSAGVFGFLSAEFQRAISDTSEQTVLISSLTEEKNRLQKRKQEIDSQIAKLPDNVIRGRTALIQQFGPEVNRINLRLEEIDKELPKLRVDSIKKNVEVGPIMYLAEAFDTTPEKAVKWVILIIICVFDPLAIVLLIAGNFLLIRRANTESKSLIESESNTASVESENYGLPHALSDDASKPIETNQVTDQDLLNIETLPTETISQEVVVKVDEHITPELTVKEVVDTVDDDPEKEVITIKQVNKFIKPKKSSLEDIDAGRVDVEFGDDAMKNFRNLGSIYNER